MITNFHAFQRRESKEIQGVAEHLQGAARRLLGGAEPVPGDVEPDGQPGLPGSRAAPAEIVVFNDEAHHCYQGRCDDPEAERPSKTLTARRRQRRRRTPRPPGSGSTACGRSRSKLGVKVVYDLSATPSFLSGLRLQGGHTFPWVVSDFSLMDAIESGIVKIPRVPVDDDAVSVGRDVPELWANIGPELPKQSRKEGTVSPENCPPVLEGALRSLYRSYEKAFTPVAGLGGREGRRAAAGAHRGVQEHHRLQAGLRLDRGLGQAGRRTDDGRQYPASSPLFSQRATTAPGRSGRAPSSSTPSSWNPARR